MPIYTKLEMLQNRKRVLVWVYTNSDTINFNDHVHYEKRDVLRLTLQLNFWITLDIYNSLYLHGVSVNQQMHELQSCNSPYIQCNSLHLNSNFMKTTHLTTMSLHYNYTHDVMLTSLIVIHLLKFYTWHYKDFFT